MEIGWFTNKNQSPCLEGFEACLEFTKSFGHYQFDCLGNKSFSFPKLAKKLPKWDIIRLEFDRVWPSSYYFGPLSKWVRNWLPYKSNKPIKNMSVIELYENGTIGYLFKKGLVSYAVPTYVEYFLKFSSYRKTGATYREAVNLLSQEYNVSGTTIKKAIKTIKETQHID